MVNAHFRYALTNRLAVAKIPIFRTVDARLNPYPGLAIFQAVKPRIKNFGRLNGIHG